MSKIFLHLTPLKEENNSSDENEENESKQNPPLSSERFGDKSCLKTNELKLNSYINENNLNNLREKYKSPKKTINKPKVLSELIVLNKPNPSKEDLCLQALAHQPNKRNQEMLNHIKSYLKSMPSFMNIISKEKNTNIGENLIEQISVHLRHEYIPKNNLICRFGEKGDKFYIILKGKISFLIPKMIKCYLNLEEYVVYLMQLRNNDEFELLNNLLVQNRIYYPFEDDDFDDYLIKEYDEYQKYLQIARRKKTKSKTGKFTFKSNFNIRQLKVEQNNINTNHNNNLDYDLKSNLRLNLKEGERLKIKQITVRSQREPNDFNFQINSKKKNYFSYQTYKKMGLLVTKIRENKTQNLSLSSSGVFNNPLTGENSVKSYLKSNNVQDVDLEPFGRKLVSVYHYEEMSTFETGQTFGFIALESKVSKRASTAISIEDTDLGILTKEEYMQFFEILSSREKKNLYELLKFYSLMTTVSEYKFVKRFYHMFEFRKFYKNVNILEIGKPFKELLIFSLGLFVIHISVNFPELNDLITKIKKIRGKLQGLSKYKIEKTLDEQRENQDLIIRRNYMSEKENKALLKKYNFTISIISDHLILGYPDTVDPVTHLPLFNCVCTSAECDGYSITNKSIGIVNQESIVIQNLNEFCLMKMEYNLKRLKQFKKEILSKIKLDQLSSFTENKEINIIGEDVKNLSVNENNQESNKTDYVDNLIPNRINYINRNELNQLKNVDNNKMKLLSNKLIQDNIEKVINIINNSRNEEKKNTIERGKTSNNYSSRNNKLSNFKPFNSDLNKTEKKEFSSTISKLRQSIINKQKRIELKIENNNSQINSKKNNNQRNDNNTIKHSLSSTSYNNVDDNTDKNITKNKSLSKSIKQMKFSNLNMFKNYVKEINKIKSYNSQMLTPFLTKSRIKTLPSIKKQNKKLKNFIKENNLKTESEPQKIIEKNINEDLYRVDQLSFVKEKFMVFVPKKRPKKDNFNTINNDFLPKLKKNNRNKPMKLQENFFKGLSVNILENNSKNLRDSEDKKNNYTTSLHQKLNIEKNSKEKVIKDKYNELNNLVNNMQNITKEILSKRK